jgi:glucose/arabinose dehydrogenase
VEQLEDRLAPASAPAGFTIWQVAGGLTSPTLMEFAPDGRLFVSEQGGDLRVIKDGTLLPTPFVHINVDSRGERGLLGIAFDPNFATNHYVYVYYTVPGTTAHNRVSRFTANGDTAVAGSEVDIFDLDPLSTAQNHNGGSIHFGTDGKLYVSAGENGNPANAQSLNTVLGKILRINPDGTIPTDNPFYSATTGNNRAIWALGLRNPFTFAVQPGTGRIFIDDVGSSPPRAREEIDDGIAGSNYGWPNSEGLRQPTDTPTTIGIYRDPLYNYSHDDGSSAITGGTFYDPATDQFPAAYVGDYFFSDLGGGYIKVFNPSSNGVALFATGFNLPTDLKVSSDGSLYVLSHGDGAVYMIRSTYTSLGGQLNSITWNTNQAGQQVALAIAADNELYTMTEASGSGWTGWTRLGGNLLQITAARNADGRLEVFAIAADNELYTMTEAPGSGSGWTGWVRLGGNLLQITAAANADGRLEVFTVAADNELYTMTQTVANGSTWTGWTRLGGDLKLIATAANADGRLQVFSIAADSALWTTAQTTANGSTWTDWMKLGGILKQIAATANADGRLQVSAIALDNELYTMTETAASASTWTGWVRLGGALKQLAVAANADGRLEVIAIAADDSPWTTAQTAANGSTWSDWSKVGGGVKQLVLGITADGRLEIFGIGMDDALWLTEQTSPGASTWASP